MSKRIPILLGLFFVIIALWVLITPAKFVHQLTERLNNLGYDLQLRTRILTEHRAPLNVVAIIDIDDRSLHDEGRWPWPRSKLASLVDALQRQGAAVIAFDIFFAEKENNIAQTLADALNKKKLLNTKFAELLKKSEPYFEEDTVLAKSLRTSQAVLAIGFLPNPQMENILPPPLLILSPKQQQLNIIQAKGYISNIPILQQAAKYGGFINIFPDSDGIIRHAPMLIVYHGAVYPSLSLQAVLTFLGEGVSLITPTYDKKIKLEGIQIGSRALTIPTDDSGQALIPFIGKSYTFPFYSATDVLHDRIPKNALLGKILFIGTSATGLGDLQATPVDNPFPGVEVQATLVNGMLDHLFSYKPAWTIGANIFLTLLFGVLAAFFFPYLGPRTLGSIMLLLPTALLFLNNWIWEKTGLVLSFLVPVLLVLLSAMGNIIYGYLFETRRREQLKEMFGQYVPEKHIDEMLKTSSDYGLHGEDRTMSVLFADIRNFTSISEGLSAADLVDMLNTFFTPMTEIIFNHHGTIDKYIGDLIMAFWGAPLKDKNHAYHALQSAWDMQTKVKEMQPILAAHHWPEIHIGIGINTGMMSVGDMGSRYRRNYTVLGDQVNLSSRVESLTKFYGVNIIVTESTQKNQPKFVFRKLDQVQVKGKKNAIAIFEVVTLTAKLTADVAAELKNYHQALDYYFQREWNQASVIMQTLQQKNPDKKIYGIYLDRIKDIKDHPLPEDWNGVYVHLTK